jgi:alpha-tubulin suppressor-like RCC1 family protein
MSSTHLPRFFRQALIVLALGALFLAVPVACGSSGGGGSLPCSDAGTCPDGFVCSNDLCVYSGSGGSAGSGQSDAGTCPNGLIWCGGECVDVQKNISHCGACNQPCLAGQGCNDGQCTCTTSAQCPQPGSCNLATQLCECASGYHPCAGVCLSDFSVNSCGSSCTPCLQPQNGYATCDGVSCGVSCNAGFHDCAGDCVSDTSPATCGSSCTPCPQAPNKVATCDGVSCGVECAPGFHDCAGQCVSNNSPQTCGSSCTPCPTAVNGTASCNGTSCTIECDPGYHVCSGQCVSDASPQTCGTSCTPCVSWDGTAICVNGQCGLICNTGYHLCSGICVPDTSPTSCGTSCTPCPTVANGTSTCTAGACAVTCNPGYHLCSGACVADDVNNCGPTCSPCPTPPPNSVAQCVDGVCSVSCSAGLVSCGTSCCTAVAVSAGMYHTCLLTSAGGAKCFGYNSYGRLGDGTTTNRSKPTHVTGLTSGVSVVKAGYNHSCAVTTSGGLKCWGYNLYGQLGDGTTATKNSPVDVSGLGSGIVDVALGYYHTCALTSGGGVKCWGYNTYGQLGDGSTATKNTPVDVSGLGSGVVAITAGYYHTCAITTAGAAKCWGYNTYGQLGDGFTAAKNVPTDVPALTANVTAITAGYYHTCAVVSGGAQCWGYNYYGQLGDGTTTTKNVPTSVSTLGSGVSTIDTTYYHTCAKTTGGAALCWGYGTSGQLGDATNTTKNAPVSVSGLTSGAAAVDAGGTHSCALTSSGGVKCWGSNTYGQLGDGTTTAKNTPVDVSGG